MLYLHGIYDSVGYLFLSSFPYGVCRYQIYDERDKSLRFSCIYNQAQIINADFGGLVGKVKVFVMNRESLRRVSYYTENPNQGFDPERENDPIAKEGYFHTWSTIPWPNPHGEDDYYNRAVAIIEEEAGNLIEVPTDWITFIS